MGNIESLDDYRKWLMGQDKQVAVAMAARISLRVIPVLFPVLNEAPSEYATSIILPVFRANSAPWFAGTWPNQRGEFRAARTAAYAAAADRAAAAAARAGRTAAAKAAKAARTAAADAAYAAARAAAARAVAAYAAAAADRAAAAFSPIWVAINNDISYFEKTGSLDQLISRPLWLSVMPDDLENDWQKMKSVLLELDEDWQVWTNWYDDRLVGGPKPNGRLVLESLERERVMIPEEDWEKGPAHVNHLIAEMEARYQVPDIPQQKKAVIELEVGDDEKIHKRKAVLPTSEKEGQEERWKSIWEAQREALDDFLDLVPQTNSPFVDKAISRYEAALAHQYEDMNVIKAGLHASRLLEQLNHAKDEMSDRLVAELSALLASHNGFIKQLPEWQEYLEEIGESGVALADVSLALEVVEQLGETRDLADEQVIEEFEEYAADIKGDYVPSDNDQAIVSDPLKVDFVRSVGNLLSVTSKLAKSGWQKVRQSNAGKAVERGVIKGLESTSENFVRAVSVVGAIKGIEVLTGITSEFAWLLPIIALLKGKKKE
ncbi:hypothetical protein RYZ26_12435 [Terasakiella sp. A23]|uniref:hypothetical protein n=1 Tax=Terasakiella sp. FCG-A23 TaxID=3080561 RepID=UPI002954E15A|nr:hypothetical protein [Terasakiella sp. A23]MDV7340404.1 hypothetical protein [Terasakiella sp. A23]